MKSITKNLSQYRFKNWSLFYSISALMILTACGTQDFQQRQFIAASAPSGFRALPAKVDLLFVLDDSPSVSAASSIISQQLSTFTNQLQTKYWDYHVAKTSIVRSEDVTSVLVNPLFNTDRLFDGTQISSATPGELGIVPQGYAINAPSQFNLSLSITGSGAGDAAYENLIRTLSSLQTSHPTNFLRSDALLAIILISNGYDRNVDTDPFNNVLENRYMLNTYASQLLQIKGNQSDLIKFYPVVSFAYRDRTCINGSNAFKGSSYLEMNTLIGGAAFDFCNTSALNSVLSNVASQLEIIKQAYIYDYIVLNEQPRDNENLKIYKNGSLLPRNEQNGWSYSESWGIQTVPTISSVFDQRTQTVRSITPLNRRTGYVIRLNGSAKMKGNDVPNIEYERL